VGTARGRTIAGAAVAALLAGCGGTAGDLLALEVAGAGATRRVVITGDGRARCDSGELRAISSDELIEAREIERELTDLAESGRTYRGGRGLRRLTALTRAGTVRWREAAPGRPAVLARAELLAVRLARALC
jgi:hypothetical protein